MAHQFKGFRATKPAARLLDKNSGKWHVIFFIYTTDNKKIPYRFSKDINQERLSDRKIHAEACADEFWNALCNGWNPLLEKYPSFDKELQARKEFTITSGLDHALKLKILTLSKWSAPDYRGCVRFMKKSLIECGCEHASIGSIERKDIRMIMATAKEQNNWTPHARNKYLTILKSLLTVLVDEEIIKYNPAHGIKNEPQETGSGFKRATDSDKKKIEQHLSLNHIDYFEYLMFIYMDGIRRKELLMIKVGDINLQKREITIRPDVAKTNTARVVPIGDELGQILMRREVYSLPKDWYVFSSDKFKPGPGMYHPNTPTDWWRELVIEGLGIDVKMYGLKHTGADDRIKEGTPLDALRTMYGHKSLQMTERYAKQIQERYKEQLIDQSPSFSGKVVEMKKAK